MQTPKQEQKFSRRGVSPYLVVPMVVGLIGVTFRYSK